MTSRSLFCKLMKEDLKQRLWSVILASIVFLIIPVSMAMQLENDNYAERAVFLRRVAKMVTNSEWLVIITSVGAVLCGLSGFWYLFSKKKVDFFHSLPVKREVLFAVRYINGVLIYAVPYLAALVVCLIMAAASGAFPAGLIGDAFAWFGFHLCAYLLLYTVTILGVMLTGNLVISMAATAVLFLYALAIYGLTLGFGDVFFETFSSPTDFFEGKLAFLKWLSPFYLYMDFYSIGNVGTGSLKLLLLAVILTAVALMLYKLRAVENAGLALAFSKMKMPVRILLVIPCGLAMGLFLYLISANNSVIWLVFGNICGVVLVHGLLESIYEYDIRKALSHKWQMVACLAVTLFITFSYQQDWFDFDGYLPKKEKVESIGISIAGFNYYDMYWSKKDNAEELDILYALAQFCVEENTNTDEYYAYYVDTIQTREASKTAFRSIKVTYRLKNGNTVSRRYSIDLLSDQPFWDALYAKTDFTSAQFAEELALRPADLTYINTVKEDIYKSYTLSAAEQQELLNALAHDLRGLQYRTLREELPVAELQIETTNYRYYQIELYACYTETLAFLEKHGYQSNESIALENVRSLTLYDYRNPREISYDESAEVDYYITGEYGVQFTADVKEESLGAVMITDPALIQEIYPYLVWDGYTTLFTDTIEQVDCEIILDLDDFGNYERIGYQVKTGAPIDEWIEKARKTEYSEE